MISLIFSVAVALTAPAATAVAVPDGAGPRADIVKAAKAWQNFMNCGALLDQAAEYNRCLTAAMSSSATNFDKKKATEFLMLELPIKALGRCPKDLEPAQARRRSPVSRFACFEIELKTSRLGGEIEFRQEADDSLRVRRIRF